mmetsp:Transcript_21894/g.51322  ORF Transcript_21894/g.51322 Transcript_21894/m.51322 type:complete len:285 (+) Transcript_21894:106-960(+)
MTAEAAFSTNCFALDAASGGMEDFTVSASLPAACSTADPGMLEAPSARSDATPSVACAIGVTIDTACPTPDVTCGAASAVASSTLAVFDSTPGAASTSARRTELDGGVSEPGSPSVAKVRAPEAASRSTDCAAGKPFSTALPKASSAAGKFCDAKSKPTEPARSPAFRTCPAKRAAAGRASFSIFSGAFSGVMLDTQLKADSATGSSSSTKDSAAGSSSATDFSVSLADLARLRAQGKSCFVGGAGTGAGAGVTGRTGATATGGASVFRLGWLGWAFDWTTTGA